MTGPVTKHVKRLIREGALPADTQPPLAAEYDPAARGYQRTSGLRMDPSLVPIFAMALDG